jgi:GH24 family phage-related lysozyme (muramidase)
MDICIGNTCKNLMRMMWICHMSTLIEECKKNNIMQDISNLNNIMQEIYHNLNVSLTISLI